MPSICCGGFLRKSGVPIADRMKELINVWDRSLLDLNEN